MFEEHFYNSQCNDWLPAFCLKVEIGRICDGKSFNCHPCFQSSTIPTYQKINAFMEGAKPNVYADSNKDGRLASFLDNKTLTRL